MRARHHPRAILGVWAWQAAVASLASWPAASLVRAAYGNDPRGDSVLWTPGSHALLDFLWREAHGISAVVRGAAVVLLASAVAGLVPTAALMVAIAGAEAPKEVSFSRAVRDGVRAFPALMLLLVVVTVAQTIAVGAGVLAGDLTAGWTHAGLGEAHAQGLGAVVSLPFLVLAAAIGVTHDLARAAVVRRSVSGMRALAAGAFEFAAAPVSLGWSWGWRAVVALALIAVVAPFAGHLGGRGGAALVLLAVLHQTVVLGRVALRASWLATALRHAPGADFPSLPTQLGTSVR
jgi:hypothetical protein